MDCAVGYTVTTGADAINPFKPTSMGYVNKALTLTAVVADISGKLVPGVKVTITATGVGQEQKEDPKTGMVTTEEVKDVRQLELTTADATAAPASLQFVPKLAGSYSFEFQATDADGRRTYSSYTQFHIIGKAFLGLELLSSSSSSFFFFSCCLPLPFFLKSLSVRRQKPLAREEGHEKDRA